MLFFSVLTSCQGFNDSLSLPDITHIVRFKCFCMVLPLRIENYVGYEHPRAHTRLSDRVELLEKATLKSQEPLRGKF